MPGALDTAMRGVAKTLTSIFGTTATLTRVGENYYDPLTSNEVNTDTTYEVPITPPRDASRYLNSGGESDARIKASDLWVSMPAKDLLAVPTPTTDSLTVDGSVYTIVLVVPVYSGAQVAQYEVFLRQ